MRSRRSKFARLLPPMSRAFHESEPGLAVPVRMLPPKYLARSGVGQATRRHFLVRPAALTRRLSMPSPQWRTEAMLSAIPNGTDVWMAVPASPPLRMTIRACLDDCCDECRLPVYRCKVRGRPDAASERKSSPTAELTAVRAGTLDQRGQHHRR